jgi:hypothetical protein
MAFVVRAWHLRPPADVKHPKRRVLRLSVSEDGIPPTIALALRVNKDPDGLLRVVARSSAGTLAGFASSLDRLAWGVSEECLTPEEADAADLGDLAPMVDEWWWEEEEGEESVSPSGSFRRVAEWSAEGDARLRELEARHKEEMGGCALDVEARFRELLARFEEERKAAVLELEARNEEERKAAVLELEARFEEETEAAVLELEARNEEERKAARLELEARNEAHRKWLLGDVEARLEEERACNEALRAVHKAKIVSLICNLAIRHEAEMLSDPVVEMERRHKAEIVACHNENRARMLAAFRRSLIVDEYMTESEADAVVGSL